MITRNQSYNTAESKHNWYFKKRPLADYWDVNQLMAIEQEKIEI